MGVWRDGRPASAGQDLRDGTRTSSQRDMRIWLHATAKGSSVGGSTAFSVAAHVVLVSAAIYGTGVRARQLDQSIAERTALLHYLPPPDRRPSSETVAEHLQYIDLGSRGQVLPVRPDGQVLERAGAMQSSGMPEQQHDEVHSQSPAAASDARDSVYSMLDVEETAVRTAGSAAPAYPAELMTEGKEGGVYLRFVVDTMGRADAAYGLIPQVPRANDPKANFFTRGACCTNRIGAGPSPTLIVDPPPPPQNTDVLFEDYAAHEIGHRLGRQHPVEGSELCNHSADDPNYPYFLTFIGTGILGPVVSDPATDLAGFDGGDASNLIPVTFHYAQNAFDVMGYCGGTRRNRQWISDYTYKGLYLSLLALHPDISRRASFAAGIAGVVGTRTAAAQSSDLLLVSGNIAPTLARAELLRTVRVDRVVSTPPRTPGNYSIRLKGAAGVTLADYSFTPETVEDVKTIGGANSPLLGFTHVVPFVTGTTEIQIVDASRASPVIGRKTVSPSPPAIHDVALLGQPDPTTGALTVDWTASDSDGDPLTFDVFFVRAGGALLQPLMLGLPGPSVQVDTSRLGGGTAQFRVVATDGVNSAAADTPPFILPNKPPQPRILTVGDGMKIHAGQMLNLEGAATDPQDGTIPDTGFTWRTQRGSLGAGSRISVADLPVGVTQITLTATNSLGLAASTTVAVTVAENLDRPGPTLTVGPTQIGWQVAVGETQPQTAELDISNSGSGKLEFRASSSAPWLTLSTTTGTAPATLTLTANPRGFAGGTTQEAGVTLAAVGLPGQTITIPVRISVGNTFSNGNPTTSTLDRPRVSGVIVAKGLHAPGILFVDLRLTNTGASRIRNLMVQQLALRTLLGSGAVTLNTLSPAFPKVIGDVNIGTSTTLRLFLNVPPTVKRFSLTENGTAQNVAGTSFTYSVGQAVTP